MQIQRQLQKELTLQKRVQPIKDPIPCKPGPQDKLYTEGTKNRALKQRKIVNKLKI